MNIQISRLYNSGFFHVFGSSVINKILTFLSSIIIVRLIPKADYGIYAYANNILGILTIFSGIGMVSGILQLCSENSKDETLSKKIYHYGCSVAVLFNLFMGAIILVIAMTCSLPVEGAERYLALLSFYPVIVLINDLQKTNFRYRLKNKAFSYSNSIGVALIVGGSILGALLGKVTGLIIGNYIASALAILITKTLLNGQFSIRFEKINKEIKKLLYKVSLISMVNNGISSLLLLADVFIIGIVISNPESIATYKIATIIPTALNFIPTAIITYIYPIFARHKNDKKWTKTKYALTIRCVACGNLIITAGLIIFAPIIIKLVFGTEYLDAVDSFRILSISYFFSGTFRGISGNLLVTQHKLLFNLIITISAAILDIIGNIVFVGFFGIIGAAITTLTITAIFSIISTGYYLKTINKIIEE